MTPRQISVASLALLFGAIAAVASAKITPLPGEAPPGRELTAQEQFKASPRGQELNKLLDDIIDGKIDLAEAEGKIEAYRRKCGSNGELNLGDLMAPLGRRVPPDLRVRNLQGAPNPLPASRPSTGSRARPHKQPHPHSEVAHFVVPRQA